MERSGGRYLAGLVVIAFGVVALLNNFGVTAVSLGYLLNLLWPVLVVVAGINFITRRDPAGLITGAILIALGLVWFGRNAGWFDVDMSLFWKSFWPIVIIVIGLNILFKSESNKNGHVAIMGSVEKNREPWDLKNAEYFAFMGGIDLDIRKARFTQPEITLNLSAIMGAVTVIVPEDIAVICSGTSILGGIELLGRGSGGIFGNTTLESGDVKNSERVLHLKCTTIMGGIEIKQ